MSKKNKIANFFQNIRIMWKDKKKRSIVILGMYAVFFLIVVVFIRISRNNYTPTAPIEKNPQIITNYQYKINIKEVEEIKQIFGIIYNQEERIEYLDNKYYIYKDNAIREGQLVDYPYIKYLKNIRIETLENILTESNLTDEVEESTTKKTQKYLVPFSEFNNYINEEKEKITDFIKIEVTYFGKNIELINLDLTNYLQKYGIEKNIELEIEYYRINKTEKFQIPEENIKKIEELKNQIIE